MRLIEVGKRIENPRVGGSIPPLATNYIFHSLSMGITQFDFGDNWLAYVSKALTTQKADEARSDFVALMEGIDINGARFLDIGFGQGLSLLCAAELGAQVVGIDINQKNQEAVAFAAPHFPTVKLESLIIHIGSILSESIVDDLDRESSGGYDVVHSWGVLHHTGNMALALKHCVKLLRKDGYLVVSIYNDHWTSPLWKQIKRVYCHSPSVIKKIMVYTMFPIIWTAKLIVTRQSPIQKQRGMDFFFDVVDWVGGYPYEFATIEEFSTLCNRENLEVVRVQKSSVPTGCNEYILRNLNN
jgi:SAM-dependent methyltransferase